MNIKNQVQSERMIVMREKECMNVCMYTRD